MTGSAADWQLRRLPLCVWSARSHWKCFPAGCGVSRRLVAHPPPQLATYLRPPAAPRPRPATPELRPEPRAAGERGGGGGGSGFFGVGGCDSLTGAIDGRRRGFSSWNLPQARSSGRNKKERKREKRIQEGWKGQLPAPPLRPRSRGAPGPAC